MAAMDGYRISEAAERTGFSPATLRYYEDIGVVPAPGRSQSGYRVYDERSLGRLTFVARAKQLGLRLDEVASLAGLWDGDECGPVQQRMADFVAEKLADTRARVDELSALAEQLRIVAARLDTDPPAGACDESCACNIVAAPVDLVCTLDPAALPGRISDWRSVVARAVGQDPVDGGVRLRFPVEGGLAATLADLAQAEVGCCAFFDFAVGIGADALTLEVRAPDGAAESIVAGLFAGAP